MEHYNNEYAEFEAPPRRNYSGCGSVFGRGRSLLFIICALIGLMGVFSANRTPIYIEPGTSVRHAISNSVVNPLVQAANQVANQAAYQTQVWAQPVSYSYPS
jgi:hypothetical protein